MERLLLQGLSAGTKRVSIVERWPLCRGCLYWRLDCITFIFKSFTVQLTPDNLNPRQLEPHANLNQNQFPLDFCHTFSAILPLVTRTLKNSNLPLTRSSFCFPLDHMYTMYIILRLLTQTMFWALKSWEETVYWCPKHWILNFPLTCCRHIVYYWTLMLIVTSLTWNSFTSRNSKMHALFRQCFVTCMLRSDL